MAVFNSRLAKSLQIGAHKSVYAGSRTPLLLTPSQHIMGVCMGGVNEWSISPSVKWTRLNPKSFPVLRQQVSEIPIGEVWGVFVYAGAVWEIDSFPLYYQLINEEKRENLDSPGGEVTGCVAALPAPGCSPLAGPAKEALQWWQEGQQGQDL